MTEAPYLVSRLQGFGTTIFAEMSALAVRTGAINLGQGFPDTDGPQSLLEDAVAAIKFDVRWGPTYDPEMLLEHAIVHLLRHRRQILRWPV